ncbi:uncharacterized protein EAE98_002695 [Botrytis deweyae]|uniref:Uncharacterized protein n=1 Tax=Botrytis deweyae TaxID=2478750 RepID=A0ABQ7IUJ8_9HELO|nr:uncharacterized protein EAE98_002695 [Botrytis deweyae]KAF7934650.1 hypothetical protein EAE98_002695 [Botrytis deweyae]
MPSGKKDHDLISMALPKPAEPLQEYHVELSSQISAGYKPRKEVYNCCSTYRDHCKRHGHLGPTFGVVFGLTCHDVFDEYKRQYPNSDALLLETRLWDQDSEEDVQHPLFRPSARLHELLGEWMARGDTTKYFYFRDQALGSSDLLMYCATPGCDVGKFLPRDIYGEEADPSGHALRQLLLAWCAYVEIQRGWLQFRGDDESPHYPSPFNMGGKAWFDEMCRIMNVYKNREPEHIFLYIIRIAIGVANKKYGQDSSVIEARRKQLRKQ